MQTSSLMIMGVLSLGVIWIPFIPGLRDLPRRVPIYRLIWREHYSPIGPPTGNGRGEL
jgi:hypothetical protein